MPVYCPNCGNNAPFPEVHQRSVSFCANCQRNFLVSEESQTAAQGIRKARLQKLARDHRFDWIPEFSIEIPKTVINNIFGFLLFFVPAVLLFLGIIWLGQDERNSGLVLGILGFLFFFGVLGMVIAGVFGTGRSVSVKDYRRKDGTKVRSHVRSKPGEQ